MKKLTDGLVKKLDEPKEGYACLTVGGQLYGIDIEKSEARMEEMWRKHEKEKARKIKEWQNMKTIEVSKDEVVQYLVESCPFLTLSMENTKYCKAKSEKVCNLSAYERDCCPPDCPKLYNDIDSRCDYSDCSRIKKLIRRFRVK